MLNINLPLQTPTQLRDETDIEQQRTVKAASWLCSAATYEGFSGENKISNKGSAHSLLLGLHVSETEGIQLHPTAR